MWIIRFHLLQTKHYNKINRICKRYDFIPRKFSPLVFSKASLLHYTQKISWRALGRKFDLDHAALYRFNQTAKETDMLQEIFQVFLEAKVAIFVGEDKNFEIWDLHTNPYFYKLTEKQFQNLL